MELDYRAMVREVKNKSQRHDLSEDDLLKAIANIEAEKLEPSILCRGHDVTAIFSLGLRKCFGNHPPANVTAERLEQILRTAYLWEYFIRTKLYRLIRDWESLNSPYVVLRVT